MSHQPHFTAIYVVPDLGTTPASVNRRTGELYINKKMWCQLKPEHRLFVLLHEMGHIALNTTDEMAVDKWAFDRYTEMGYSLQESVKALTRVLHGRNPEHHWRVYEQLMRAANYDFSVNQNPDIYRHMAAYMGIEEAEILAFSGGPAALDLLDEFDYATGKVSRKERRQDRKDKRQEARQERRETKTQAKAYKKETQADTNYVLADKWGINARAENIKAGLGGVAKIAGAVGGSVVGGKLAGALAGGGEDETDPRTFAPAIPAALDAGVAAPLFEARQGYAPDTAGQPGELAKNNIPLYIAIGGVILVVLMVMLNR